MIDREVDEPEAEDGQGTPGPWRAASAKRVEERRRTRPGRSRVSRGFDEPANTVPIDSAPMTAPDAEAA